MAGDSEERNKVFGMPRGADPRAKQGEESQRVLGVPVDWYGPVDLSWLPSIRHPIKAYKRWALRRRFGPYAPDDESDPESQGWSWATPRIRRPGMSVSHRAVWHD